MNNSVKLSLVKSIHTLVWLFFNLVLIYLFYAAITDQVDVKFWVGLGLIFLECVILIVNRWTCPLSPMARKYTDSSEDNFDIFLPNWLAKYNIQIYSTLFVILMLILLF